MIKRIRSPKELSILPKSGIEAQKIRALLESYGTDYDFCAFFLSDSLIIAKYYEEVIICEYERGDKIGNYEELCGFLKFGGFSNIFCSEKIKNVLSEKLSLRCKKLNLMRFSGTKNLNSCEISEISLSQAYEILKTSFDFNYEQWYLDMSHRIRHGISRLYGFNGSVLAVQHDLCGEALLSQIATLPEQRGKGNASWLISAVCQKLSDSAVFLLCEDKNAGFYERLGFKTSDIKFELSVYQSLFT